MSNYNTGFSLPELIASLPPGVDRAILRVLSFHVGRDQAIGRAMLRHEVASLGFNLHERALRAAINQLRKAGQPILSTGGEDGGYWMAAGPDEVQEFIDRELTARIADLAETKAGILAGSKERWGEALQGRLF